MSCGHGYCVQKDYSGARFYSSKCGSANRNECSKCCRRRVDDELQTAIVENTPFCGDVVNILYEYAQGFWIACGRCDKCKKWKAGTEWFKRLQKECKVCKLHTCNECNKKGAHWNCKQIRNPVAIKNKRKRKKDTCAEHKVNVFEHYAINDDGGHCWLKNLNNNVKKSSRWRMKKKRKQKTHGRRNVISRAMQNIIGDQIGKGFVDCVEKGFVLK